MSCAEELKLPSLPTASGPIVSDEIILSVSADKKPERTEAASSSTIMIPLVSSTKNRDGSTVSQSAGNDEYSDVHKGFPRKLFIVLGMNEYNDIIAWLPHGRGFMIKDRQRLTSVILPKHFKKAKFPAFTRKLNRWCFTRVTRGPERGAYYNPYFQRDNRRLSCQMSCFTGKRTQAQQSFNPISLGLTAPAVMVQPSHHHHQMHIRPMPEQSFLPPHAFMMNPMYWMMNHQQNLQKAVAEMPIPMMSHPQVTTRFQPPPSQTSLDDDTSSTMQRWDTNTFDDPLRNDGDTVGSIGTTDETSKEGPLSICELDSDFVHGFE